MGLQGHGNGLLNIFPYRLERTSSKLTEGRNLNYQQKSKAKSLFFYGASKDSNNNQVKEGEGSNSFQKVRRSEKVGSSQIDDFEEKVKDSKFLERNKYWVVIVDDEESIRLAVGDYLYDQGYQVTACADADAFLEVCQQGLDPDSGMPKKLPDAIVSDIRMPGKDGIELLGLIRSDERLGRVPVILLTAKAMTQDRIAGYKAGANAYLPKPFAPEELLSILDNQIQRRQQMTREKGQLVNLKEEMASIKEIMRQNGERVVQKTEVYLTVAEREVLELLCRGYTNKEIAKERGTNLDNINKMIQKLYATTQTQTRTELVRWALKTGYISKR